MGRTFIKRDDSVCPSAHTALHRRQRIMMSSAGPKTLNSERTLCWWWLICDEFRAGKIACTMSNIAANQKHLQQKSLKKKTHKNWKVLGWNSLKLVWGSSVLTFSSGQWRPLVISINHPYVIITPVQTTFIDFFAYITAKSWKFWLKVRFSRFSCTLNPFAINSQEVGNRYQIKLQHKYCCHNLCAATEKALTVSWFNVSSQVQLRLYLTFPTEPDTRSAAWAEKSPCGCHHTRTEKTLQPNIFYITWSLVWSKEQRHTLIHPSYIMHQWEGGDTSLVHTDRM